MNLSRRSADHASGVQVGRAYMPLGPLHLGQSGTVLVGVCLVIFGVGFALVGRYQRWSFKEAPNEVDPEGMGRLMRGSAEWSVRLGLAIAALGVVVLAVASMA